MEICISCGRYWFTHLNVTCDRVPALLLLLGELVSEGNGTADPTPHAGKRCVKFSEGAQDDDCGNQYVLILYVMYNQVIKPLKKRQLSLFTGILWCYVINALTHPTCCDEASFSGHKLVQWSERKPSLLHTLERAGEGHRREDHPLKIKHTHSRTAENRNICVC